MGVTQTDAIWNAATRLLECVHAQVVDTVGGDVGEAFVTHGGQVAWDHCHCGQLTVHIGTSYPADQFPAIKTAGRFRACGAPFQVVEFIVTILRCVPTIDDQLNMPSGAELSAAARIEFADREALQRGVVCCYPPEDPRRLSLVLVGEHLSVGGEGACSGSELHVLVGFPNCEDCP